MNRERFYILPFFPGKEQAEPGDYMKTGFGADACIIYED
jgi:hypothetical protein